MTEPTEPFTELFLAPGLGILNASFLDVMLPPLEMPPRACRMDPMPTSLLNEVLAILLQARTRLVGTSLTPLASRFEISTDHAVRKGPLLKGLPPNGRVLFRFLMFTTSSALRNQEPL